MTEYDLDRFMRAQAPVYDFVIAQLGSGRMPVQYMDFIFPRLNLGRTGAQTFSISSLDEAGAYLSMPSLGGRYRECVGVLQRLSNLRATAVFGVDGTTCLHQSLTLFSEANRSEFLLETMFEVWFEGLNHEGTILKLRYQQGLYPTLPSG